MRLILRISCLLTLSSLPSNVRRESGYCGSWPRSNPSRLNWPWQCRSYMSATDHPARKRSDICLFTSLDSRGATLTFGPHGCSAACCGAQKPWTSTPRSLQCDLNFNKYSHKCFIDYNLNKNPYVYDLKEHVQTIIIPKFRMVLDVLCSRQQLNV